MNKYFSDGSQHEETADFRARGNTVYVKFR